MSGGQLHRVRPYYWGAIYISDAECGADFDIDFHNGGVPVLSTASHVAVLVVHAGTVDEGDGDVILDVLVTSHRADQLQYEVVLEVPSGRLNIGDADDSDDITLGPGRWLLQFEVDDPAEAHRCPRVRLIAHIRPTVATFCRRAPSSGPTWRRPITLPRSPRPPELPSGSIAASGVREVNQDSLNPRGS